MKKKNRKSIKVPAALFGLTASNPSVINPYVGTDYANVFGPQSQSAGNANIMKFQAGMADRNPYAALNFTLANQIGVGLLAPKKAGLNVAGAIGGIADALPDAMDTLTSPFLKSTATTGGEATMLSIAGIGKGAASGAKLGSALGPMGAAVGAVAGAAVGLVGKGGKKASMQSFTDYDEGTLGTGLIGAFKNKKLRKRRNAMRLNAFENREAIEGTLNLQEQFASENNDYNIDTFANGGSMNSLAYVDDGELIQTPNGSISKVPENGNPTDSNLVSLPTGSRVLSDTLKVPGTKKTFALMGEKMMSKKKSKGKDKFAENAAKLNLMNDLLIHDLLFELQEATKSKKGIKNKTKNVQGFAKGGKLAPDYVEDVYEDWIPPTITSNYSNVRNAYQPTMGMTNEEVQLDLARQGEWEKAANGNKKLGLMDALSSSASAIGSLVPIMSNMFTKEDTPALTNYNPYAGAITSAMGKRRFNIDPALRDIVRNRNVTDYNANQINTSTGANMAYRLLSAIAANNAIANLRSQESNINNQYSADYANVLNNLGQQWVAATNLSDDINARNRATARNIRRTGMSQLSQWGLNREQMRNQKSRDNAMLELYAPFLKAGFTEADLTNFQQYLRKGGNR